MSEAVEPSDTYSRKFGAGVLTVFVMVILATANVYTNLAPTLSSAQQSALLSGLASVLIVLLISFAFVAVIVGRESLSALRTLAAQARRLEQGEFDASLATNRDDEIGDTYRAMAAMRDSIDADREPGDRDAVLAEYCETMTELQNGARGRRLDESVDDPQLAELALRVNEFLDRYEKETEFQPDQ